MPDESEITREVPADIRRLLRAEVGFGCSVPQCRSPFLQYHHFDPEWHVEHHHRPEGIIPLCATHHAQASAFTVDQLRQMKINAHEHPASGRFQWLRNELVGVVGGNLYHETPVLVQFAGQPMVWFNRDEHGNALLNVRMLTTVGKEQERIRIQDNDFILRGSPSDFECPPSGRILRARYENGDYMRIEFRQANTAAAAANRYKHIGAHGFQLIEGHWPMTFVEVTMQVGGSKVRFSPNQTTLPGNNVMRGCVTSRCSFGLSFN